MNKNVYYFPSSPEIDGIESNEEKQNKVRKISKKKVRPKFIFISLIALYLLVSFGQQFYLQWKLKAEITELDKTLMSLQAESTKLQARIDELQGAEAIEQIAREKLGMVKKGETVVMQAVPGEAKPKIGEYELGD